MEESRRLSVYKGIYFFALILRRRKEEKKKTGKIHPSYNVVDLKLFHLHHHHFRRHHHSRRVLPLLYDSSHHQLYNFLHFHQGMKATFGWGWVWYGSLTRPCPLTEDPLYFLGGCTAATRDRVYCCPRKSITSVQSCGGSESRTFYYEWWHPLIYGHIVCLVVLFYSANIPLTPASGTSWLIQLGYGFTNSKLMMTGPLWSC